MSEGLGPRPLSGEFISLEPLEERHIDDLGAAARDPEIWEFLPILGCSDFEHWWELARAEPQRIPFAVRRLADNVIVGSTSYLMDAPAHARVEIGSTWYVKEAQGTAVNPEAKLLLLQNAFEKADYNRVEFKTDSRNKRSNVAIRKLGAKEEGILRAHMWMPKGYWRDSVTYSILKSEWPEIKKGLVNRLQREST